MNYIKPTYKNEAIESSDVILVSISLGGGVTLTEKGEGSAQVEVNANDILGLR